jgi:hypothetical protein
LGGSGGSGQRAVAGRTRYAASTSARIFAPKSFSVRGKSYWLCKFKPERRAGAETAAEAQGGVGGNAALAVEDFRLATGGSDDQSDALGDLM